MSEKLKKVTPVEKVIPPRDASAKRAETTKALLKSIEKRQSTDSDNE
jgi:hypothetical protein